LACCATAGARKNLHIKIVISNVIQKRLDLESIDREQGEEEGSRGRRRE
jgi:hypothetical protein